MDIISFNEASTANERIRRVNANPDSDSGVVTVPKTIASGETITIPAGRVAVLPNVTVDGDLVIEAGGEVFVPAGAGFNDLDQRIDTLYSTKQDNLVVNDPAVKTALNASGTAPIYACRAWVNFNGTGTVAIRASGNVSSITDLGTGLYRVNFTTAMPDTNYAVSGTGGGLSTMPAYIIYDTRTVSSVRVGNGGIHNIYYPVDGVEQSVAIFI